MKDKGIGQKEIAERIIELLDDNWDVWAAYSSREGGGKSTAAINQARFVDEDFDIKESVVYRKIERLEKLKSRDQGQGLVIDEGLESYYKQLWNVKQQKYDNILYTQVRQWNLFISICASRFFDLNPFLRSWRYRNWFHILSRGRMWWSVIDDDPFCGPDPWHMLDKKTHMRKCRRNNLIFFNKMPKDMERAYVALKDKAFNELIKEIMDESEDKKTLNNAQNRTVAINEISIVDRLKAETGWNKQKCLDIVGLPKEKYYRIKREEANA